MMTKAEVLVEVEKLIEEARAKLPDSPDGFFAVLPPPDSQKQVTFVIAWGNSSDVLKRRLQIDPASLAERN